MKEYLSSVSPKGQITIPVEIRKRLGVKPRDRVVFYVEDDEVKIKPFALQLAASFQSVPPLNPPKSISEMTQQAWDEHASNLVREGV